MSILEQLEAAGAVLPPAARALLEQLETLAALVPTLQERIRELEAKLGQNSTNSSKPPSSDGPGVVRPPKRPTGKKRGGQPGHPGHYRKRIPPERVNEVVVHWPKECRHCESSLKGAAEAKPARVHQVVEFAQVKAHVVEHQMKCVRCPNCGKLTRAELPTEVGEKHFGPRLATLVGLLIGYYGLSRRATLDFLRLVLDVPVPSLGSTEAFTQETSAALRPVHEEVTVAVRRSEAVGVDETSWKLGGKKHWLWAAVTQGATLFHLGPERGKAELRQVLGSEYDGVVTSDRWCAYQICPRRQICWAHLKRDFKELVLRGGATARWAERGVAECTLLFKLWWEMQGGSITRDQLRTRMRPIRARLRRLIRDGAKSADGKVAGFCRNVLKLWRFLWTFLKEPVEPTNNAAERALRPAVLWRKRCFGNQSESGLRYTERVLTLSATCRQRKIPAFEFLCSAVSALRAGTPAPRLLATD